MASNSGATKAVASCENGGISGNMVDHPITMFNDEKEPLDTPNYGRCLDFAVKLCKAAWASAKAGQNVVISPLGAESALCAMYLTATDQACKDQISSVLGLTKKVSIDNVIDGIAETLRYLTTCQATLRERLVELRGPRNHEGEEHVIEFTFANAIFINNPDGLQTIVRPNVLAPLEQKAGLQIRFLNGAASDSSAAINAFVMEKTKSSLADFISSEDWKAEPGTAALVNTVHLKAEFILSFDSIGYQHNNNVFTLDDGTRKETEIMKEKMPCMYGVIEELEGAEMLRLEYADGECRLFILLPNEKREFNTVEKLLTSLTGAVLQNAIKNLEYRVAKIQVPRVRVEETYDMIPVFKTMGLTSASVHHLTSGPSGGSLPVRHAFQKTKIGIEPNGTEEFSRFFPAAEDCSLTTSSWGDPNPVIFHAVHPFCIFVQHLETGAILCAGAVGDSTMRA